MSATTGPRTAATTRLPILTRCACGTRIILGEHEHTREILALDATPVLVGATRCPACKGKGARLVAAYATGGKNRTAAMGDLEGRMTKGTRTSCPDCLGTGRVGELLDTGRHVVMTIDGVVRARTQRRATWDSVYRCHECARAADRG